MSYFFAGLATAATFGAIQIGDKGTATVMLIIAIIFFAIGKRR